MNHIVPPGVKEIVFFFKRLYHWFEYELKNARVCLEFPTTSNRHVAQERVELLRKCTGMLAEAYRLPIIAMCNMNLYDGVSIPLDQLMKHFCPISFLHHTACHMYIQKTTPRVFPLPKTLAEEHAHYNQIIGPDWLTQMIASSHIFECDAWVIDSSDSDITVLPDQGAKIEYSSINPRLHFDNAMIPPQMLQHLIQRWSNQINCRLECSTAKVQRALQIAWHAAVNKTLQERVWNVIKTIDGPCLIVGMRDSSYHRVSGNNCWIVRDVLDYI